MLASKEFSFRRVTESDLTELQRWLLRPHVAEWWGPPDSLAELRDDYITNADDERATQGFIAAYHGRDIGFIQCYCVMGEGGGWWEDETDPGARGIDQFLAHAQDLSRGLGRAMLRNFVELLFTDPAVTVVQTDPSPRNERAIRCYLASGFKPIGEVATPDGVALLLKQWRSDAVHLQGAG